VWQNFDPFFESAKISATFCYPWPKSPKKFQKKGEKNGHTKKVTINIHKNIILNRFYITKYYSQKHVRFLIKKTATA